MAVLGKKPTHSTKEKMLTGTKGDSPTETDEEDYLISDDKGINNTLKDVCTKIFPH